MIEHVLLFSVIALISSLVYHSLRAESLRAAIIQGTKRFVSFLVIAVVFGVALHYFTRWL